MNAAWFFLALIGSTSLLVCLLIAGHEVVFRLAHRRDVRRMRNATDAEWAAILRATERGDR